MIYQNVNIRNALIKELEKVIKDDERIIYRDAFRWKDTNGDVLNNHYECQGIKVLSDYFNYEVVHNFNHVVVIKDANKEGE